MTKKAQFTRAEIDDYAEIAKSAEITTFGLGGLREQQDFNSVQKFRDKVEKAFQLLDTEMTALCGEDQTALTNWASRMGMVRDNLYKLDRSLAFKGKRQFNWPEVLGAMGLLNALRVATEQTVSLND